MAILKYWKINIGLCISEHAVTMNEDLKLETDGASALIKTVDITDSVVLVTKTL